MTERLRQSTVTFQFPFSLDGLDATFPAGNYAIETTEQQLSGLSFVAYRRLATTIALPLAISSNLGRQLIDIELADLEQALARDAEHASHGCKLETKQPA